MLKNAYFRAGLVWTVGLMLIVGLVAVLVTGKDDMWLFFAAAILAAGLRMCIGKSDVLKDTDKRAKLERYFVLTFIAAVVLCIFIVSGKKHKNRYDSVLFCIGVDWNDSAARLSSADLKGYRDADVLAAYCYARAELKQSDRVESVDIVKKYLSTIPEDYSGDKADDVKKFREYVMSGNAYDDIVERAEKKAEEARILEEELRRAKNADKPYVGMKTDYITLTSLGKVDSIDYEKATSGTNARIVKTFYSWNVGTKIIRATAEDGIVTKVETISEQTTQKTERHGTSGGGSSSGNMMTDPDDYDNPDDFADDAWGTDFDDWDDAYDYWEDY